MWGRKIKAFAAWILIGIMVFSNVAYAGEWIGSGQNWYYEQDGVRQTGWIKDGNDRYNLDGTGKMRSGWFQEGSDWFFLNTVHDGYYGRAAANQWLWIDGYCYSFDADGKMYADCTTPDGYQVDKDGRWVDNGKVQFIAGKGIITKTVSDSREDDSDDNSDVPGNGDTGNENGAKVTREKWITVLAELIGLDRNGDGQYSYDDYLEAENPALIEAAVRAGFVPISPDEDNMVYFNPTDYATREFVAYTAVHALSYDISESDSAAWADAASLTYAAEDYRAVALGILSLSGNRFNPEGYLKESELNQAKMAVKRILDSTKIDMTDGNVEYVDGVTVTTLQYALDEEDGRVFVEDEGVTAGWKPGEIHILHNEDGLEKDIAVKVVSVAEENGSTVIYYEEPALEEVVVSMDVEGVQSEGGFLIPAEGVEITPIGDDSGIAAYAATSGELDLFQKYNIALTIDDLHYQGTFNIQNLEYRFSANTEWFRFSIDEVYFALNSSMEGSVSYTREGFKEIKKKLADFNVPLGWGFNASGELYLVVNTEGGVEASLEINQKTGIQYTRSNGIRPVSAVDLDVSGLTLTGDLKAGAVVEPGAEFLGINLVSVGAEGGLGVSGELETVKEYPYEFCLDATSYIFLTLYAQIGPDDFNLRLEREILNSDNASLRDYHFEETGPVDECTRGSGTYEGYVKDAETEAPIYQAKVQVLRDGRVIDTTYTDNDGYFIGLQQKHGSYTLRVSAAGFLPYEQAFDIIGGQTTVLETQLMISRENQDNQKFECGGNITDAFNGLALSGVRVEVRTAALNGDGELIAEAESDEYGNYQFSVPAGNYEITAEKEGYTANYRYITIAGEIKDINLSLNPENQSIDTDNLRIVLRWGLEPSDLDSHLVGPNGHVSFLNMVIEEADLDVDDVTSYGPETISIFNGGSNYYSYYVHDFTNRGSFDSKALSSSGAYVQVYSGNVLLYTMHVPTGKKGTLWHVFDYDFETGRISLVNRFSYVVDPEYIGGISGYSLLDDTGVFEKLKSYEFEAENVMPGTATPGNAAPETATSGATEPGTATPGNAVREESADDAAEEARDKVIIFN